MKRSLLAGGVLAGLLMCSAALADVRDINGVKIESRTYNDFPESDLTVVDDYPTEVSWTETGYETDHGGWANMHRGWLSSDGGTNPRGINHDEGFLISFDAYLDAGSVSPRKEAGFRASINFGTGREDALFIITSDGEVAAFGANWPFYKFGDDAYNLGEVVRMGILYDAANETLTYLFGDQVSPALNFAADRPGWQDDSYVGVYGQFAVDHGNPDEYGVAQFGNFGVVPEPSALMLLALAGLFAVRRR